MEPVTYGALIDSAGGNLAVAEQYRSAETPPGAEMIAELRRMTASLARHLAAAVTSDVVSADAEPAWRQAAIDVREAMRLAVSELGEAVRHAGPNPHGPRRDDQQSLTVTHLSRTADALSAAHDLLQTHRAVTPGQDPVDLSGWAQLVTARPVTLAMTWETRSWADRIASWLDWIQDSSSPGQPEAARTCLAAAGERLRAAGQVMARRRAVPSAGREVLRMIPPAATPTRIALASRESGAQLCAGIARTADRLRAAAFPLLEAPLPASGSSGPAWLQAAGGAAIICDVVCRVLHQLAGWPGDDQAIPAARFRRAAGALTQARAAWRQAAAMWQVITTETQDKVTGLTAEVDDLVLRMGRLAYANPAWTPHAAQRAPLKEPADLAGDDLGLASVIGAVHQAADALAALARADLAAITAAGRAGRLYMPNIVLWDERFADLDYAPAPHDRIFLLCDVYRAISNASVQAARQLSGLALAAGVPSQHLSLIRQASPAGPAAGTPALAALPLTSFTRPVHYPVPGICGPAVPESSTPGTAGETRPDNGTARPGPAGRPRGYLESRLRTAGITDPGLILRAAAIDQAGEEFYQRAVNVHGIPASQAGLASRRPQPSPRPSSRR